MVKDYEGEQNGRSEVRRGGSKEGLSLLVYGPSNFSADVRQLFFYFKKLIIFLRKEAHYE